MVYYLSHNAGSHRFRFLGVDNNQIYMAALFGIVMAAICAVYFIKYPSKLNFSLKNMKGNYSTKFYMYCVVLPFIIGMIVGCVVLKYMK